MIYLDNAATSWPKPETVCQAMCQCMSNGCGSPGRGGHSLARAADFILYEAREELAALFGVANPGTVMFSYNATDALNTALFGLLRPGDTVVTTSMEHNAVARPLRVLETRGVILKVVSCDHKGQLDLKEMKAALANGARAVVAGHGSNVTGSLLPLNEVGRLAADADAIFIVDAAQTAGVEPIMAEKAGIAVLAFSGHKGLMGPQGTGGLYVREDLTMEPLRYGGTGSQSESDRQPSFYPDRLESGTPNTPGIAGLLAGVRFVRETGLEKIRAVEQELTALLLDGLAAIPGVRIYGPTANERRSAVISLTIDGLDSGAIAHRLDREFGIACRSGLHCAPWAHQTIGTLATGTVRLSPGYFNTVAQMEEAIEAIRKIAAGRG